MSRIYEEKRYFLHTNSDMWLLLVKTNALKQITPHLHTYLLIINPSNHGRFLDPNFKVIWEGKIFFF